MGTIKTFILCKIHDKKICKKDKFKINRDLIPDKLTLEYINESEKLEYIFKCILSRPKFYERANC